VKGNPVAETLDTAPFSSQHASIDPTPLVVVVVEQPGKEPMSNKAMYIHFSE
jgi:hypothetical protein